MPSGLILLNSLSVRLLIPLIHRLFGEVLCSFMQWGEYLLWLWLCLAVPLAAPEVALPVSFHHFPQLNLSNNFIFKRAKIKSLYYKKNKTDQPHFNIVPIYFSFTKKKTNIIFFISINHQKSDICLFLIVVYSINAFWDLLQYLKWPLVPTYCQFNLDFLSYIYEVFDCVPPSPWKSMITKINLLIHLIMHSWQILHMTYEVQGCM